MQTKSDTAQTLKVDDIVAAIIAVFTDVVVAVVVIFVVAVAVVAVAVVAVAVVAVVVVNQDTNSSFSLNGISSSVKNSKPASD